MPARSPARSGSTRTWPRRSALGHDLGHPPFGHAGERALDHCLAAFGGFDHNAQTLHVVTALERRYADFDGLNLTWETLEGLVKHNGPLTDRAGHPVPRYAERGLPRAIADYSKAHDLQLWSYPSAEAQCGAIADDIAYDAHDIDDGLRAEMFRIDDLAGLPLVGDILRQIAAQHPRLEPGRHAHELIRRLITLMIEDVIAQSRRRIVELEPGTRRRGAQRRPPSSGFPRRWPRPTARSRISSIRGFTAMPRIARIMDEAEEVVRDLFALFRRTPSDLPAEWLRRTAARRCHEPRAADRRFHRRHDRPLRAGGAHADLRRDAGTALEGLRLAPVCRFAISRAA